MIWCNAIIFQQTFFKPVFPCVINGAVQLLPCFAGQELLISLVQQMGGFLYCQQRRTGGSDSLMHPVIKTAVSNTAAVNSIVIVFLWLFIVSPISSLLRKRLLIGRQYQLPEYQPIRKKQYTEKAPCRPLRAKKGDVIHISTAEQAA